MKFNTKRLSSAVAIGLALCSSIGYSAVLDIATLSNRPHLRERRRCRWCRSPRMRAAPGR